MSILNPDMEDSYENLLNIFENLFKENYDKIKDMADDAYAMSLGTIYQQGRIAGELEEIMKDEHFSFECAKNLLENMILSLREDSAKGFRTLEGIKRLQKKYGFTNSPTE